MSYLVVLSSYDACVLMWRFLGTYGGEEVAVKVLNPENFNQNTWSEFKQEIYMLRYSAFLWKHLLGYYCCVHFLKLYLLTKLWSENNRIISHVITSTSLSVASTIKDIYLAFTFHTSFQGSWSSQYCPIHWLMYKATSVLHNYRWGFMQARTKCLNGNQQNFILSYQESDFQRNWFHAI